MKMDSQPKSSSTEGPPELETPKEVTDYTSNLPGLVFGPEQTKPEESPPTPEVLPAGETSGVSNIVSQQIESLARQGVAMPRVRIIEDGQEKVGPLDTTTINMITQLAQLGQLNKIRKSLKREQFEGKLLSMTLSATEDYQAVDLREQQPFKNWVTASFVNKGPNSVYLAINKQRPYHTLDIGDSLPADFTKADERIYFIEYYCDSGETATVRALGKY